MGANRTACGLLLRCGRNSARLRTSPTCRWRPPELRAGRVGPVLLLANRSARAHGGIRGPWLRRSSLRVPPGDLRSGRPEAEHRHPSLALGWRSRREPALLFSRSPTTRFVPSSVLVAVTIIAVTCCCGWMRWRRWYSEFSSSRARLSCCGRAWKCLLEWTWRPDAMLARSLNHCKTDRGRLRGFAMP